jgi:hypothetical protein
MVNTTIGCQLLPSWPSRDLVVPCSGVGQQSQWPATNSRLAAVRSHSTTSVQLRWRGADGYAMSMAMTKAIQGDHTASGVHVTDRTFPTRLGPPPLSPPV